MLVVQFPQMKVVEKVWFGRFENVFGNALFCSRLYHLSLLAFVTQLGFDAYVTEKAQQIVEASTWEGGVFRE
jgi:hypothetical protein